MSTTHLSDADAFDFWFELMSQTYRVAAPRAQDRKMHAQGQIWTVGQNVLSDVECDASKKWRDKRLIYGDSVRYLKVRRYLTGSATLVTQNDIWQIGPGATHLIDQSREVIENSSHNRQVNLFVRYDDIGYDPEIYKECQSLTDNDAGGALIAHVLSDLMAHARTSSETKLDAEVERFLHVLRLVLELGAETGLDAQTQTARRRLVLAEIAKRSLSPDLTVDRLLGALPFSRSTVYRDFAESGGVARAVRRQRILTAWHRLATADPTSSAVEDAALSVGFSSIFSFSRAFKRETGLRPSEVVGILNGSIEPHEAARVASDPEWRALADVYRRIRTS